MTDLRQHPEMAAILQAQSKGPIGILGFGVEGQSTLAFLVEMGITKVLVMDRGNPSNRPTFPNIDIAFFDGQNYLEQVPKCSMIFRSAGIRPDLEELKNFKASGKTMSSQIELFLKLVPREQVIAISGTLGKGSCCAYLEQILLAAKIPVALGGNFGISALDLLKNPLPPHGFYILELSSFQLSTVRQSPAFTAILKTTVEHLDWHLNQQEYWEHKSNLCAYQNESDFLVACSDVRGSQWIAEKSKARIIRYGTDPSHRPDILIQDKTATWADRKMILAASTLKTKGVFNLENAAAALALALEIGVPTSIAIEAIQNFPGLEHRLEYVTTYQNCEYYNDSYSTRPDATLGAVQSFTVPMGLILGGSEKNVDFAELATGLSQNPYLKAIALIGQTAERLNQELLAANIPLQAEIKMCRDLDDSLLFLQQKIETGAIILSPACASFGLFANYKERGKIFKKKVMEFTKQQLEGSKT